MKEVTVGWSVKMGTDPEHMYPEVKAETEAMCRRQFTDRWPDLGITGEAWRHEPAHIVSTDEGDFTMPDLWLFTVEAKVEVED